MIRLLRPLFLAAIAATASLPEAHALGRLFFTPQQRAELDRQRIKGGRPGAESGAPMTLNGRVVRSSGRHTTWINGVPLNDGESGTLPGLPLRPGETLSADGQERSSPLNGGKIIVNRAPPKSGATR